VGLASWFRVLGSERSYFEKGTLAVPSMLGPRCEEGPLYQLYHAGHRAYEGTVTALFLNQKAPEVSGVSRGLMEYRVL